MLFLRLLLPDALERLPVLLHVHEAPHLGVALHELLRYGVEGLRAFAHGPFAGAIADWWGGYHRFSAE